MSGHFPWRRRTRANRAVATCLEVGRVLQRYLDGEVDDLTARQVARHLEACRRCGLEASTYADIKAALAGRSRALPEDAVDRLHRFGEQLMQHQLGLEADDPEADDRRPG